MTCVKNSVEHSPTCEESDPSKKSCLQENPERCSLLESSPRYICNLCNISFSSSKYRYDHMKRHVGDRPHVCNVCQRSFIKTVDLKRHLMTHSGEKPYVCSICKKSFNRKGNLKAHLLSHSGEKPHLCSICNQSFSLKVHLRRHTMIHTGEKPHACRICSITFRMKSHLNRHMVIHSKSRENSKDESSIDKELTHSNTSKKSKKVNSVPHLAETSQNSPEDSHPAKLRAIEEIYYIVNDDRDVSEEENKDLHDGDTSIGSDVGPCEISCDIKEENIHDGTNVIVKEEHDVD